MVKNLHKICLLVVSLLLAAILIGASASGKDSQKSEHTHINSQIPTNNNPRIEYNIVCDDNISNDEQLLINRQLELLPDGIKRSFANRGWIIEIIKNADNLYESNDEKLSCVGLTEYTEKKIYITPQTSTGLIHEMGHYTAYISCFSEYTTEFQQIYHDEANAFAKYKMSIGCSENETKYIIGSIREYYADSFRYILLDSSLEALIPKTAAYIQNDISKLENIC